MKERRKVRIQEGRKEKGMKEGKKERRKDTPSHGH